MPTTSPRPAQGRRPAQAVTSAPQALQVDRSRRMRQYLIAMGVRTISFPLAVWAFSSELYVLAWILAGFATFIPSFAVMIANAVDSRRVRQGPPQSPVQGLGPAPAAEDSTSPAADRGHEDAGSHARGGGDVFPGEVVRGEVVRGEVVRDPSPQERRPWSTAS